MQKSALKLIDQDKVDAVSLTEAIRLVRRLELMPGPG